MKYVFVQLFPALNAAELAKHARATGSDAFGRAPGPAQAEEMGSQRDGEGGEAAAATSSR